MSDHPRKRVAKGITQIELEFSRVELQIEDDRIDLRITMGEPRALIGPRRYSFARAEIIAWTWNAGVFAFFVRVVGPP